MRIAPEKPSDRNRSVPSSVTAAAGSGPASAARGYCAFSERGGAVWGTGRLGRTPAPPRRLAALHDAQPSASKAIAPTLASRSAW